MYRSSRFVSVACSRANNNKGWLQTTRKTTGNVFRGRLTRKKSVPKNCLHTFRNLYYFLMRLFEVISSTSSRGNPFVFRKVTPCTAKQRETRKNVRNLFRQVTRKNMRNLYTRFVSRIFWRYKRALWPFHESSVAGLSVAKYWTFQRKFQKKK